METVISNLNQLADYQAQAEVIRIDYEEKRRAILKSVQAELDALDAEYEPIKETVAENIGTLATEIKTYVLEHGETVKGEHVMAVYVSGRVSWDTKKLDGMMSLIPQLAEARKQGDPSVTLRKIG